MQSFQEKFLEEIIREYLSLATPARKLIFKLRFDPEFHPENKIKPCSNKEIASMVQKQLNEDVSGRIGTELKWIIRTLASNFESQMTNDEVDVELLRSEERGKHGKWQRVYDWLWQKHFPYWLLEHQWQELVAKANRVDDWLQVTTVERNLWMPEPRQPTAPLQTDVYLRVNLNCENRYFLLLNQGTDGTRYCLCPSQGFAPSGGLFDKEMYLPQISAMVASMKFQEPGKEHFLGIVVDKALDLQWLHPNDGEPVPKLNANRLNQLWETLEQQGDQQMFYKCFDVV